MNFPFIYNDYTGVMGTETVFGDVREVDCLCTAMAAFDS
jgi:hypothetical protein